MIISERIIVKGSKYYKELGYDISEKYIDINISDLKRGSHVNILAKCDYCEKVKEISFKMYNKNILSSVKGKFACSNECGLLKSIENNIDKYGVDHPSKLEITKIKSKETMLKKYGVDHPSKMESVKISKSEKMKSQSNEVSKRVVEYWSNISDEEINIINKKREDTCLDKYGETHVSKVEEFKEKIKETNIEKYGGFTYQSKELSEKVKQSNLEKFGFENPSSSLLVREKVKETNLDRYGFEYPSQNQDIKDKIKRRLRKVNPCTICFPISENSSIKEIEVRNYISEIYDGEIISSYRNKLEIDIFLPELKIGFEFNGLYWHSEDKIGKDYHRNKLDYFKNLGIRIYNIWEDDWDNKRDIIKSQIKNWVGISTNKIWARSCQIVEIDDIKLSKEFLDKNHIQGNIRSSIKIGLLYNSELVSIMTFDNLEGRKKMETGGFNLSRFCSKLDTNVIGGASKILKFFIDKYKPKRIISFADLDWSDGNLYFKLGFNLIKTLNPDYKYIVNFKRENKQKFTKKKLIKRGFDPTLTESIITKELGYDKIFNCGQLKFEIKL